MAFNSSNQPTNMGLDNNYCKGRYNMLTAMRGRFLQEIEKEKRVLK